MNTSTKPQAKPLKDRPTRLVSRQACLNCRERKIKCNGVHVCRNCKQLDLDCIFVKSNRGGNRKRNSLKSNNEQSASLGSDLATASSPVILFYDGSNDAELANHPTSDNTTTPSSLDVNMSSFSVVTEPVEDSDSISIFTKRKEISESPQTVISDEDKHRAAIASFQLGLDEIQTKVNNLKSPLLQRIPSSSATTTFEVRKLFTNDPQQLKDLDLPSLEIIEYFIDLYYEYFYPNQNFLLPKSCAFSVISIKTDVTIFHSIFAVVCRFADDDHCAKLDIHPYMRDCFYWIAQFEKHRKHMFPFLLMKSMLLIGMVYTSCEDSTSVNALKIIQEALQVCRWHNLDKKYYCTTYELTKADGERKLRSFTPQQLMIRESHIRSIWELWKLQLQLAILDNDKSQIPPFNGDLCLPVSDEHYYSEFRNWDYKYSFWHDVDADLLNICNDDTTLLGSAFTDDEIDNNTGSLEKVLYSSSSLYVITANLLSLTFKLNMPINEDFIRAIENRVQILYSKIPRTGLSHMTRGGGFGMSFGCIFCTSLILNYFKAESLFVYLRAHTSSKGKLAHITVKSIEAIDAFLMSNGEDVEDVDLYRNYLMCQWSALAVCKMLQITNPYTTEEIGHELEKHYSPLVGVLIYGSMTVLASELALQLRMRTLGLPVPRCRTDSIDFTKFPEAQGRNPVFTNKYGERNWPIGFFGDATQYRNLLDHLHKILQFQEKLWPRNKEFLVQVEVIMNHLDSL